MMPAFEPWLPTYIDLVKRKTDGDPEYQNVGFGALDIPASLTNVTARKSELEQRFTERYAYRRISSETLQRWQVRLQNRFDEIGDKYERAFALYAANTSAMMTDILPGWEETMDRTDADSGTDTNTRSGSREMSYTGTDTDTKRYADTPDSSTNASDFYADKRQESTRSFDQRKDTETFNLLQDALLHGKTTDIDWTKTHIDTGSQIIDAVNEAIAKWKDLDTQFVAEFEDLFLNIFDY